MLRPFVSLLVAAYLVVPLPALADTRVALVIANGAYEAAALPNPPLDAKLVADGLTAIGFDVTAIVDADLESMSAALNAFEKKADGADVALFYYAGHGFAVPDRGVMRNYLMPTSADVTTTDERLLRRAGFPLDEVIDSISALAKTTLVFIDACRNDPTVRSAAGTGRGMVLEDGVGSNVFVGMSTRAGDVAQDGPIGEGSPFARAFAGNIGAEGRLDDAFTKIRLAVQQETDAAQRPDVSRYDLDTPLYLASAPEPGATPAPTTTAEPVGEEVRFGLLGGFTGRTADIAGPIADSVDLAFRHINEQGGVLGGMARVVRGDDGCNQDAAGPAAFQLANVDNVIGILGSFCAESVLGAVLGATTAASIVQVSPAVDHPFLTTFLDYDLVYRTTPSEAYPLIKLGDLLLQRGISSVALAYDGNDHVRQFADAFARNYAGKGGSVTVMAELATGAADYTAEISNLTAGGSDTVVVISIASDAGGRFLKQAVEMDAFNLYYGGYRMLENEPMKFTGVPNFTSAFTVPRDSEGGARFHELIKDSNLDASSPYIAEAYDAAFILALAAQKSGRDKTKIYLALRDVANAPGERILPGEWDKAVRLLAEGKDIDYENASGNGDFDAYGDVPGQVIEAVWEDGAFAPVGPIR